MSRFLHAGVKPIGKVIRGCSGIWVASHVMLELWCELYFPIPLNFVRVDKQNRKSFLFHQESEYNRFLFCSIIFCIVSKMVFNWWLCLLNYIFLHIMLALCSCSPLVMHGYAWKSWILSVVSRNQNSNFHYGSSLNKKNHCIFSRLL